MKDSLFEMLMSFFEKSLSQLTENKTQDNKTDDSLPAIVDTPNFLTTETKALLLRPAQTTSIRVFTYEEQMKFTKASYQFLSRMLLWGIIASENMEQIIEQLLFSESRYVTLQETKWTIRNTLAASIDAKQLAFLDLVLYQQEDKLPLH